MTLDDNKHGTFWSRLSRPARTGLIAGIALIIAGAVTLAMWSSHGDYAVLFAQLNETDAAAVVAQLKQQKVPYRLTGGGATIEVPAARVYDTRLSLFSSGVPLSGGVGFELYDHQGYGLTEEDQRVEYQRALQGELARTIDSLQGVRYARVHLVVPPDTIFKADRESPSAAVSLVLAAGATLSSGQVEGIQRLVAASVAGLEPSEVVINDQRGVTLSAVDPTQPGMSGSDARLTVKRDVESYLERKIAALLDRAYGPGQALVSVDVALNFDQVSSRVQSLVPLRAEQGQDKGAVLRRQEVETGSGAGGALATGTPGAGGPRPTGSTTDVEYEYGRRVDQIVSAPGSITRMSIAVVVPGTLTDDKRERITDLVRMAAGASQRRGDEIDVETVASLGAAGTAERTAAAATLPAAEAPGAHAVATSSPRVRAPANVWSWAGLGGLMLLLGAALGLGFGKTARGREGALTEAERQRLLVEMERLLTVEVTPATRSGA